MQLSQVITHLGAVLRLPQLAADEGGACAFRAGGVDIRLEPRPRPEAAFVLRAFLGDVDVPDFAPLLERLLRADFFAGGVGGPALGLDAQAGLFLTQHFEEGRHSLVSIEAWLARFIAHARVCQGLLVQARAVSAPPAGVPA